MKMKPVMNKRSKPVMERKILSFLQVATKAAIYMGLTRRAFVHKSQSFSMVYYGRLYRVYKHLILT